MADTGTGRAAPGYRPTLVVQPGETVHIPGGFQNLRIEGPAGRYRLNGGAEWNVGLQPVIEQLNGRAGVFANTGDRPLTITWW